MLEILGVSAGRRFHRYGEHQDAGHPFPSSRASGPRSSTCRSAARRTRNNRRAGARERDRQTASRAARTRRRRARRPWSRRSRRSTARPATRDALICSHECSNAQAYRLCFLAGRGGGDQLPAVLRRQRPRRDPDGIARGLRGHPRPALATGGGGRHHRIAHRSSGRSLSSTRIFRETAAASVPRSGSGKPGPDGAFIYLLIEKILSGHEKLRAEWPVHGTTGYDFTNDAVGLLVDTRPRRTISGDLQAFPRAQPAFRAPGLREEAAGDAAFPGQRRERAREHARSTLGTEPLVPRFHPRRAEPRGARNHCLFPGLPHLSRPGSAGQRGGQAGGGARGQRRPNAGTRRWRNRSSISCATSCCSVSRRHLDDEARATTNICAQVSTGDRADHGQGSRGHGLLYLQPAGGAERGWGRTPAFRIVPRGVSRAERRPARRNGRTRS